MANRGGLLIRGTRVARTTKGGVNYQVSGILKIKPAGITRVAVANQTIWKRLSDGTVDTVADGDTTTAAANILGLGFNFFDSNGVLIPADQYPYFAAGTTAGFVQCYVGTDIVYETLEDSVGGPISTTGSYSGSVGMAGGLADPATILPGNRSNDLYAGDLLDSSTKSTTITTNACILDGIVADPLNDGGSDTGSLRKYAWQWHLGSTFSYYP